MTAVLVAGAFAVAVAPTASAAETAPIDIRMTKGDGVYGSEYHWQSRGTFDFTVTLTDTGAGNLYGTTVFVSVPEGADVTGWAGERWDCEHTGGGIDCTNPDLVVPGEAWPELTVQLRPTEYFPDETLDVYATSGGYGAAHEGVAYYYDTSL
ncbi:hypothetical protein [Lentzea sp. NBRC 105346]|uniref:hypothetical protein n=1 Tax=Lentzea sp. NBRC 105346 TaxID=3032205 RepID=UPI0025551F98|nr:hypothetical protein [Lentzea sp. NBRC 105346]